MDESQYLAMIQRYASPQEAPAMQASLAAAQNAPTSYERERIMADLAGALSQAQRRAVPQPLAMKSAASEADLLAQSQAKQYAQALFAKPDAVDAALPAANPGAVAGNLGREAGSPVGGVALPAAKPFNPGAMASNMGSDMGSPPQPAGKVYSAPDNSARNKTSQYASDMFADGPGQSMLSARLKREAEAKKKPAAGKAKAKTASMPQVKDADLKKAKSKYPGK